MCGCTGRGAAWACIMVIWPQGRLDLTWDSAIDALQTVVSCRCGADGHPPALRRTSWRCKKGGAAKGANLWDSLLQTVIQAARLRDGVSELGNEAVSAGPACSECW